MVFLIFSLQILTIFSFFFVHLLLQSDFFFNLKEEAETMSYLLYLNFLLLHFVHFRCNLQQV